MSGITAFGYFMALGLITLGIHFIGIGVYRLLILSSAIKTSDICKLLIGVVLVAIGILCLVFLV